MKRLTLPLLCSIALALSACDFGEPQALEKFGGKEQPARRFFTVAAASAVEGQPVIFTVRFNMAAEATMRVPYATANGTATAGSDYTAVSGTLEFAPGETTKTISVPTTDDFPAEPPETFRLVFGAGENYDVSTSTQVAGGTIEDNDIPGTLHVANATATEGNAITFNVRLANTIPSTVTVNYATTDGTATLADLDYTNTSGTLTFLAGETTKTIVVPTTADTHFETSETFTLTLSGGANYVVTGSDLTATGQINNNDVAPTIAVNSPSAAEGSALAFAVTLSNRSYQTVTVNYATANGTATLADLDYTASSGSLVFNPGETAKSVLVATTNDTRFEPDETLTFTLSGGANYTAGGSTLTGTGTIINDDAEPTLTIADATANEGSSVTFTVTQDRTSSVATTFTYATVTGSAGAGDFTATSGSGSIAAGATTFQITVPALDDSTEETSETFSLHLAAPVNATFARSVATGTIVDSVLAYDFMAGTLPPGTIFTRASGATYVSASGAVTPAAASEARFDHAPGTNAPLGLLMEKRSTNLLPRNTALNDPIWNKNGLQSVAANGGDTASPDGANTTAELLTEDGNLSNHSLSLAVPTAVPAGSTVQFSVYLKPAASARDFTRLTVEGASGSISADFSLSSAMPPATASTGSGGGDLSASIEDAGNGWRRLILGGVASAADTSLTVTIATQDSFGGSETYQGDGASGLNAWGAQLELGNEATSLIYTNASAATREPDILRSGSFTGFGGAFGDGSAWSMITDFSRPRYASPGGSNFSLASALCEQASCEARRVGIGYHEANPGFASISRVGGTDLGGSEINAAASAHTVYQLGTVKSAGSLTTFLNGMAGADSGALSLPNPDALYLGGTQDGTAQLQGHLRKVTFRPRAVPTANMQALTSD